VEVRDDGGWGLICLILLLNGALNDMALWWCINAPYCTKNIQQWALIARLWDAETSSAWRLGGWMASCRAGKILHVAVDTRFMLCILGSGWLFKGLWGLTWLNRLLRRDDLWL
jgi:hypothetical protein